MKCKSLAEVDLCQGRGNGIRRISFLCCSVGCSWLPSPGVGSSDRGSETRAGHIPYAPCRGFPCLVWWSVPFPGCGAASCNLTNKHARLSALEKVHGTSGKCEWHIITLVGGVCCFKLLWLITSKWWEFEHQFPVFALGKPTSHHSSGVCFLEGSNAAGNHCSCSFFCLFLCTDKPQLVLGFQLRTETMSQVI